MKISVLLENTGIGNDLVTAHGLSLFIESGAQRILFDIGPGAQFAENAQKMGIDLASVDYAVLSHGHYDHGGGLDVFLRRNSHAPVYVAPGAFRSHTSAAGKDIGLCKDLAHHPNICETAELFRIDSNALLFSSVSGTDAGSPLASDLLENGAQDRFSHEQNLILTEGNITVLFAGCAHCGVLNILKKATQLLGREPDWMISGFHLAVRDTEAPSEYIGSLAVQLSHYTTRFATCHCTGEAPFRQLHAALGEQIRYIRTGDITII